MWGHVLTEATTQQNFNFGFSSYKSEILIHLSQWQYWWWFWFAIWWTLYYFIIVKVITKKTFNFNITLNTSIRGRGKWGDFLVALIPVSWCCNILINSNFILRMIEWQNESSLFTIRIQGKQWYWVYKYDPNTIQSIITIPKNVGHNKWYVSSGLNSFGLDTYYQAINLTTQIEFQDSYINFLKKNEVTKDFLFKNNFNSELIYKSKINKFNSKNNILNYKLDKFLNYKKYILKNININNIFYSDKVIFIPKKYTFSYLSKLSLSNKYSLFKKFKLKLLNKLDDNLTNEYIFELPTKYNFILPTKINIKLPNKFSLNDNFTFELLNKFKLPNKFKLFNNFKSQDKFIIDVPYQFNSKISDKYKFNLLDKPKFKLSNNLKYNLYKDYDLLKELIKLFWSEYINNLNIINKINLYYNLKLLLLRFKLPEIYSLFGKTNIFNDFNIFNNFKLSNLTNSYNKTNSFNNLSNKSSNTYMFKIFNKYDFIKNNFIITNSNNTFSYYNYSQLDDTSDIDSNLRYNTATFPLRIVKSNLNNQVIKMFKCDNVTKLILINYKINNSGETLKDKTLYTENFWGFRQKKYKRTKNFTYKPEVVYDNKTFKIKKFKSITNNNNFVDIVNLDTVVNKSIKNNNINYNSINYKTAAKINKYKTELVPVTLARRLLRTKRTLVIPAHINLTVITNSYDVVHSWFIPGLGIKLDCVPGRSTHHTFYVDNIGFYYGQCAEICGRYHHHMPIRICALPFEQFVVWWNSKGLSRLNRYTNLKNSNNFLTKEKLIFKL